MVWLKRCDLEMMNFKHLGKDVLIDSMSVIINPEKTHIGDYSRIDAFTFLSGDVRVGIHSHIPIYCSLVGSNQIRIGDHCSTGAYTYMTTTNADYKLGSSLINPTIPPEMLHNNKGPIVLENHVVLGAHCLVLPDAYLEEGCRFGAYSMIKGEKYTGWALYVGKGLKSASFKKQIDRKTTTREWMKLRDWEITRSSNSVE
jgi:acetyltransferase-like isoleucine patch superfamily enzyme